MGRLSLKQRGRRVGNPKGNGQMCVDARQRFIEGWRTTNARKVLAWSWARPKPTGRIQARWLTSSALSFTQVLRAVRRSCCLLYGPRHHASTTKQTVSMPEGDTILKIAHRLTKTCVGQRIVRFESRTPTVQRDDLVGRLVVGAEARGKHLLIRLEGDLIFHTHLGREGRWRLHPQRTDRRLSRFGTMLSVPGWDAVCDGAPTAEWLSQWQLAKHPHLSRLGPDILSPNFPVADVVTHLLNRPNRPLGVSLLDQQICAGIGNIYKSEMLFLAGLDPFAPVHAFDSEVLGDLLRRTRTWMRRNLNTGRRRTRWHDRGVKWVYMRAGDHCLKCDTMIDMKRQGPQQRSTYYCPHCQGVTPTVGPDPCSPSSDHPSMR
ncbi:MAG: DNA-formamidopyrimidine glycosylase family protein [Myxococcota bacterium]|nr:DNA-formamidopyrimidine glycosylase family protein [Myxococcota bacterium]